MVIMQPSLDINKFPRTCALMIKDFMNNYIDLTYEQRLESRIQKIQVRNENSPNELATFNLNKNPTHTPKKKKTEKKKKEGTTIQQEFCQWE